MEETDQLFEDNGGIFKRHLFRQMFSSQTHGYQERGEGETTDSFCFVVYILHQRNRGEEGEGPRGKAPILVHQ